MRITQDCVGLLCAQEFCISNSVLGDAYGGGPQKTFQTDFQAETVMLFPN